MKKVLGISLVVVLAVLPMVASAAAPEPLSTYSTYSPSTISSNDTAMATTKYVKGAYNAAIGAVNYAIGGVNDVAEAVNKIPGDVVETVNSATVQNDAAVDITNLGVSGDATINLDNASVSGTISNTVTNGTVSVPVATGSGSVLVSVASDWNEDDSEEQELPVTVGTTTGTYNVQGTGVSSTFTSTGVSGITVGTANMRITGSATAETQGLYVGVAEYQQAE